MEQGATFVLEDKRVRESSETTCVVEPNEFPEWLTHQSCIGYKFAKVVPLEQLFALKISGKLRVQPDKVPLALLARIFESAPNSTGIDDKVAEILEQQGYINLSE